MPKAKTKFEDATTNELLPVIIKFIPESRIDSLRQISICLYKHLKEGTKITPSNTPHNVYSRLIYHDRANRLSGVTKAIADLTGEKFENNNLFR